MLLKHLEGLQKMKNGEEPGPPIAQLLGIEITGLEKGMVTLEMEASEKLHNPMGTLHGGVLCDLSDLAMGYAFVGTLADDELFTTVEIKLNFLKPIWEGKLRAEGKIIKKGSSTGLVECHVYDKKGSLVSHSTSTCMILKGNADGKRFKK
ncbi:hotdog fold thioesterase [Neobacillus bataviensis]|uniref:PaaI family thioesterase n=1 Tax=Neobacillus bataviensis TaxID=220685 RepID=UPI0002E100EA